MVQDSPSRAAEGQARLNYCGGQPFLKGFERPALTQVTSNSTAWSSLCCCPSRFQSRNLVFSRHRELLKYTLPSGIRRLLLAGKTDRHFSLRIVIHQPQSFSFRIVAHMAGRVEVHSCTVFRSEYGPMRQAVVIGVPSSGKIHPSSTDLPR